MWVYARLISLQLSIIGAAAALFLGSALLLREAGASLLLLFLFQAAPYPYPSPYPYPYPYAYTYT